MTDVDVKKKELHFFFECQWDSVIPAHENLSAKKSSIHESSTVVEVESICEFGWILWRSTWSLPE